MKKIVLIAIMFSLSLGVYAQRGGGPREMPSPEQRAERMTNRMAEELALSDEQKNKVYEINLRNAKTRQAEMEARRAEAQQARGQRQVEMQDQIKEIEAVLSPDQAKKWAEMRDANRQDRQYGPQGPRGPRGAEMQRGRSTQSEDAREGKRKRKGKKRGQGNPVN